MRRQKRTRGTWIGLALGVLIVLVLFLLSGESASGNAPPRRDREAGREELPPAWPEASPPRPVALPAAAERPAADSARTAGGLDTAAVASAAADTSRAFVADSSATAPGRIVGRVVDIHGVGIAEARVSNQPLRHVRGWRAQRTDHTGAFVFQAQQAGGYRLQARKQGLQESEVTVVTVEPGGDTHVELVVTPGRRLTGEVSADGVPVAGAWLSATKLWPLTSGFFAPRCIVQSGADGRYVMTGLAPGIWRVRAGVDSFSKKKIEVELGQGEETILDIDLHAGTRLHGQVFAPDGRPVAGPQVSFRTPDGELVASTAPLGPDGRYETSVGLPAPGEYVVVIERRGLAWGLVETIQLEAPGTHRRDFTLQPNGTLMGSVHDPAGRPVAGRRVRARHTLTGRIAASEPASAEGSFLLSGLLPGPYAVEVAGAPPLLVELPAGGTVRGLVLVANELARLHLTLHGAIPEVSYGAVLAPLGGGDPVEVERFPPVTPLDFRAQAPGRYELRAWSRPLAYFADPLLAQTTVSLVAGESLGISLTLAPSPSVEGVVHGEGPVPRRVFLRRDATGELLDTPVHPDRSFRLCLPAGTYTAWAAGDGHTGPAVDVDIGPGQAVALTLELP